MTARFSLTVMDIHTRTPSIELTQARGAMDWREYRTNQLRRLRAAGGWVVDAFGRDPNAMVVKELRQAVRSRFLVGLMMLFLTVLVFCTLLFLFGSGFQHMVTAVTDARAGARMFSIQLSVLACACLFVPISVAQRLGAERAVAGTDLYFITTLSPGTIVRGKFVAGMATIGLLFCLSIPFMVFTYLLRGIDIPSILTPLAGLFLGAAAVMMASIALAAAPASKHMRVLVGLPLAAGGGMCIVAGVGSLFSTRGGLRVGGAFATADFWWGVLVVVVLAFSALLLLHAIAVVLLSPPHANRMFQFRVSLTVAWLLWAALALGAFWMLGDAGILLSWLLGSAVMCGVCLCISVSESSTLSVRVRRAIPRRLGRRVLAFPFTNGPASGLTWAAVLMGVTLWVVWWLVASRAPMPGVSRGTHVWQAFRGCALIFEYAGCYALTAAFLRRWLHGGRPSTKTTWIVALYLLAGSTMVAGGCELFGDHFGWGYVSDIRVGNVFTIFRADIQENHAIFTKGVGGLVLLLNIPWLAGQVKAFRPPEEGGERSV